MLLCEHLWCTMATIDLNLLRAFVTVYDTGSFSSAADRLGVPRSTVSRAVAALEESLGVLLFHRTTRKVSPSTAGTALYDRVVPSLAALEASLTDLPERNDAPSGILRVTATADIGTMVLAEVVTRFTSRYPGTQVQVHLTSKVVDLVRHSFDLAVRVAAGPLRDSSLVARKVGSLAIQLYASPAYLARRGVPRSPEDLQNHDVVGFHDAPPLILHNAGSKTVVDAKPRVSGDDMFFVREVLKAGGGVGALPSFMADAEVTAGTLARVMPRWVSRTGNVYLVHPGRKHLPRKVTAFRDLLTEMLRQRPLAAAVDGSPE